MSAAFAWVLVRLRWLVVPAWIGAAVLATAVLPSFTDRPASATGGLVPTSSGSLAVEKQGVEAFGSPLLSRVAIVQRDANGLSADAQKRALRRALRIDRGRDTAMRSVAFALPISNAERMFPSSRERGTTVITFLYFRRGTPIGAQLALAHTYEQRIRAAGDPITGVTGTIPAREAEFDQINRALPFVEAATVGLIALVLLIVFRGVGAPLVTLAAAGLSFLISVRVLTWTADRMGTEVPREVEPVLVALLLGLTTDYAVFFLSGARRRLVQGERRVEAAQRSARLVLPIVFTAGLIVAVGSASLVIGSLDFFRAFGPGMAVTVLVTLAVTVTLVPALIAIFGRALFWPGLRESRPREPSRARRGVGRVATARPVAAVLVIATAAVLVVAALETRSTALGLTLFRGLPESSSVQRAASAAGQGFARGIIAPTEILVRGPGLGQQRAGLERLQRAIEREPGVAGVVGVRDQPEQIDQPMFVNEQGNAARFAVIFDDDPLSTHAIHALGRVEDDLPSLVQRAGLDDVRAGVAGDTALAKDSVDTIHDDIARVALALLLANLVLLAIFLRALVAPLYLLAASVLALAATHRRHDLGLPGLLRPPGPDLLRPLRRRRAAALARLRLQHLHRRPDLAGSGAPAGARGDQLCHSPRVGDDHDRRPYPRRFVRPARADPDPPDARARLRDGGRDPDRHVPGALDPGAVADGGVRPGVVVAEHPAAAGAVRPTGRARRGRGLRLPALTSPTHVNTTSRARSRRTRSGR